MPYFKDLSNKIHFIESIDFLHLLPSNVTPISEEEANPALSLSDTRRNKWEEIKSERDRRMSVGGYQVDGHWFHSDQTSRTQQLGLIAMGNAMPSGFKWKVMSNGLIDMTPTLAQEILFAAAANDNAIFGAALVHKAAMEESQDPASYDFSGGWPLMYQETL